MNRKLPKRRPASASLVVLLLVTMTLSCARVERVPTVEVPAGEERISGRLIAKDAQLSVGGAEVRIGDRKTVADSEGRFVLRGDVPGGKQSLVAEKRFPSGNVRRVMGIAVLYVSGNPISLNLEVRDATFVDRFCEECHPSRGKQARKDQMVRDVHVSGVVAKRARKWPEGLDESGRVTCESCHTAHVPTDFGKYLTAKKEAALCKKCH